MKLDYIMKIIDFRCRPPYGNMLKDWIFSLEDKPGNPGLAAKYASLNMKLPKSLLAKSMDMFLDECGRAEIEYCVVPLRKLPTQSNEDLSSLLREYPDKFIGMAGIQPIQDGISASLSQIEKYALNGPCMGIYMEPGLDPQPWEADNPAIFPVYEFCESHDLPVCLLFGGNFHRKDSPPYDLYAPGHIEILAHRFPSLRIMLSHACWPFSTHACAIALNLENVWLSPDGFMLDHPGGQDYVVAANYRLQNKMVFGSLYPGLPLDYAVQRCKNLLRPEVWNKFFHENAARFLKLNPPSQKTLETDNAISLNLKIPA